MDQGGEDCGWDNVTRELRRCGEPLRDWFEVRFPDKRRVFADFRGRLKYSDVITPPGTLGRTVGWGYELMFRFMLGDSRGAMSWAEYGADVEVMRTAPWRLAGRRRLASRDELRSCGEAWAAVLQGCEAVCNEELQGSLTGSPRSIVRSARACWLLALLSEFSVGAQFEQSQIAQLPAVPTIDDALGLAPDVVVDDFVRLHAATIASFAPFMDRCLIFGPELSSPIPAFPDMILGSTLIDIKCHGGRRPRRPGGPWGYGLKSSVLFQVLAYALLARPAYGVDGVGIFNPRWHFMYEVGLGELFEMAGCLAGDVDAVSEELIAFISAGKPEGSRDRVA